MRIIVSSCTLEYRNSLLDYRHYVVFVYVRRPYLLTVTAYLIGLIASPRVCLCSWTVSAYRQRCVTLD